MEVIVQENGTGRFVQKVIANNHVLYADEPKASGGNDMGPSPYDFLLIGLGACTSMTIRMYADLKKISLEKIIVKLRHEKIYAKDCAECADSNSKIDHILRQIEIRGKLSSEERSKLLDIANKCPVHRTLTSKITITTEMI